ncbi:RDD family protein [Eisenibacter elegans]|uniref:RDD family protein n=1 Tax=Eisenibacter elegans TaxID=997 RepID=UPI000429005E|nr:RDD family protein [Eisenibacter elegans]
MKTLKITTSQNVDLEYRLASIADRILAYLIDMAILWAYIYVLIYGMFGLIYLLASSATGDNQTIMTDFYPLILIILVILLLPALLYNFWMETFFNGQTIGKMATKIYVISQDGNKARLSQYFLRWILGLVDFSLFGLVGLITALVTAHQQRVGDLVAGTIVIKGVLTPLQAQTVDNLLQYADKQPAPLEPITPIPTQNYIQGIYTHQQELKSLKEDEIQLIKLFLSEYNSTNTAGVSMRRLLEDLSKRFGIQAQPGEEGLVLQQILDTHHDFQSHPPNQSTVSPTYQEYVPKYYEAGSLNTTDVQMLKMLLNQYKETRIINTAAYTLLNDIEKRFGIQTTPGEELQTLEQLLNDYQYLQNRH